MTTPEPNALGSPRRTVLLAQPGAASDRLREALRQAGAEVVLVADPSGVAVDAVIAAEPDSVLVALDPTVEGQLERFDAVLGDPSITVIFDEAELAARREGWDAARWSRHLQAKLYGHDDVLPPGQSETDDDYLPQPGLPVTPEQHHAQAAFGDYAEEADLVTDVLPIDAVGAGLAEVDEVDADMLEVDETELGAIDFSSFDINDERSEPRATPQENVAGLDEFLFATGSDEEPVPQAAATPAAPARSFNHQDWSLDESEAAGHKPRAEALSSNHIEDLERRIAGLSLADTDSYGHGPLRGAVVLLAGLGGPDAVRQILKGLPEGFPRPVLIRQRLDGGQYDKLVGQMARASAMPVQLATANVAPEPGNVYVVPPNLGLVRKGADLLFAASADPFEALPANDTAIVVLSGGDTAAVDPAMRLAAAGALVAGQSAEGCFEPSAANDVVARGGETGLPARLAERLAERWPV
ncbi:chemotaxis protein [Luteimonas gilva]|uniref:Chemotaxis protein n=1 Tax=Luteimonas gilva TaxID=2572684 RepID=A0A4U5JZB9_9GAMM|nr:chemotaxis protein CheB [Luteimonas gilva]TKR34101.1 chemotaxis protein [Luteimonas gilva]